MFSRQELRELREDVHIPGTIVGCFLSSTYVKKLIVSRGELQTPPSFIAIDLQLFISIGWMLRKQDTK